MFQLNQVDIDCFQCVFANFRSEMVATRPTPSLPNQLNEIKTFLNTPIDKFKLRNPTQE